MAANLHEVDFHAWAQDQARFLREGRWQDLDLEHLAEEVEAMGASQRRELHSRLKVLLLHLLKWKYQPHLQGKSWRSTIKVQRKELAVLLRKNPSLHPHLSEELADAYELARAWAEAETGLDEATFPAACPYTVEQVLDPAFLPD